MKLLALLTLLAPLSLLAASLLAARDRAPGAPRARATTRAATLLGHLLALGCLAACLARGPATSPLVGAMGVGLSGRLDALSALLFAMVSGLGAVLMSYSHEYLDGDRDQARFLGRLAATLAYAELLVLAGNLVQLLAAWVGTSLALHGLLAFYPDRPGARRAARKKFLVARAGDLALAAAVTLLVQQLGTTDLAQVASAAARASAGPHLPWPLAAASLLLCLAAILKSAVFPLQGWLLDVMETPTPVSALLHAGLINAGTFLVVRLAEVVAAYPPSLALLATVGAVGALVSSAAMATQPSVKSSLAYSSSAHMAFMLMLCGLGLPSVAALHLVGHSLYKAHAFLSSGSAVEKVSNLGDAPPEGPTPWWAIGLGFVAAPGLVFGVDALLGGHLAASPATAGLGALFGVTLAPLFFAAGWEAASPGLALVVTRAALGVTGLFFSLEAAAAWTLGDTRAAFAAAGDLGAAGTAAILGSFGLLVALQARLPAWGTSPTWRRLYVHLRSGLYSNAVFDLWTGEYAGKPEAGPPRRAGLEALSAHHLQLVPGRAEVSAALEAASREVAPLWPLEAFVATNPFLGYADRDCREARQLLGAAAGVRLTLPLAEYGAALAAGRILPEDLEEVAREARERGLGDWDAAKLRELSEEGGSAPRPDRHPTLLDIAGAALDYDWERFAVDQVSAWAASYFDRGLAPCRSPHRDLPPYAAWRAEAAVDRTPEVAGIPGFRSLVAALPEDPVDLAGVALDRLEIPAEHRPAYLRRLAMSLAGWIGHARHRAWVAELHGGEDGVARELLAIRLAWELLVLEALGDPALRRSWAAARPALGRVDEDPGVSWPRVGAELLQEAYERALAREALAPLETGGEPPREGRADTQAVFCIDVRSEAFRTALEDLNPAVETVGFAGFFGFGMAYRPLGRDGRGARCPALVAPATAVDEVLVEGPAAPTADRARRLWYLGQRAWRSFKSGAVSCFAFVGPVGATYLGQLIGDSLGWTRPLPAPGDAGLPPGERAPDPATAGPLSARVDQAEGLLRALGPGARLARLVLLVGHGATTTNNPYATGLDCGACGGHPGDANAQLAAAVLADPAVRQALGARGLEVPADTVFLAARHDTTLDEVRVLAWPPTPASHRGDRARLDQVLQEAGRAAQARHAGALGLATATPGAALRARARSWSQVRPEWGLAGCRAFVAAPRHRSRGVDLAGRAFLHDYDWRRDEGSRVLEQVMTAPLVVAAWINLQYYASALDNGVLGAGNKVLHNVVGGLGVLEGGGGDLRVGLPLQSVHDGARFVHEPVRLTGAIEAPVEAMTAVIARSPGLRQLLDNGWMHLVALDEAGRVTHRYLGGLRWSGSGTTRRQAAG